MSQKPDEYKSACMMLEFEIRMIEDLNKELPFIMKQYSRKKQKDSHREFGKLDEKTKSEFDNLHKFLFPPIEEVLKTVHIGKNGKKCLPCIEVPDSYMKILIKETLSLPMVYMFDDFIREMCLVYLIAQFESLLEKFLRITFNICPRCLASKKTVTFEELVSRIRSNKEILKILVEKEVNDVLRLDVGKWDDYFARKFKVDMSKCVPDWRDFKERFYRRHIILHNLGVVNEEYKKKTGYKGEEKRLIVSGDYLSKSIHMIRPMSYRLACEFSKKFNRELKT